MCHPVVKTCDTCQRIKMESQAVFQAKKNFYGIATQRARHAQVDCLRHQQPPLRQDLRLRRQRRGQAQKQRHG